MPRKSAPDHSRRIGTTIVPGWSLKEDHKIDDCVSKKAVNQVPYPARRAFKDNLPKVFAFQIACLPLCHHYCWKPNDEDTDVQNPEKLFGSHSARRYSAKVYPQAEYKSHGGESNENPYEWLEPLRNCILAWGRTEFPIWFRCTGLKQRFDGGFRHGRRRRLVWIVMNCYGLP